MTDFGRRIGGGDMRKSVYDPNNDGVIALAQTEADMTSAVYDPVITAIQALLNAHHTRHENGGADEIDATGLTGIPVAPLLTDGTAGRKIRFAELLIDDGTNADTLKCTLFAKWNGDNIAVTDNIAKGATTGNYTLTADGKGLTIEATGITGNCVAAHAELMRGKCNVDVTSYCYAVTNDIYISLLEMLTGSIQDICALVDTGAPRLSILYVTDA
ncbi:MAG: hypothetical protein ACFFBQ_17535 [Promethearchaeota archaeon]